MGSVKQEFYGIASSTLSIMRMFGQAVSMAIVSMILSIYTIDVMPSEYLSSLLNGIRETFIILAITCVIGIACSMARGSRRKSD